MISTDDYLYFVDRALDGICAAVAELGDELACRRPPLPGANHAYGILTHCLGVIETWTGGLVHGRPHERDRDGEFLAEGPVAPLLARTRAVREVMAADLAASTFDAPLAVEPAAAYEGPRRALTQGAAWQHVFEELAQHHGQVQLTRDLLLAGGR